MGGEDKLEKQKSYIFTKKKIFKNGKVKRRRRRKNTEKKSLSSDLFNGRQKRRFRGHSSLSWEGKVVSRRYHPFHRVIHGFLFPSLDVDFEETMITIFTTQRCSKFSNGSSNLQGSIYRRSLNVSVFLHPRVDQKEETENTSKLEDEIFI